MNKIIFKILMWLLCVSPTMTYAYLPQTISPTDSTAKDSVAVFTIEEAPSIDTALVRSRLKSLENRIPLTYNSITHQFVEFFAFRKPSFTKTMLERQQLYFPMYEEFFRKYDLPDELKYLSMIESGLNPRAISYAGAGGLWQFMPRTATLDFGLRIDSYVDERFDPIKSTEAACKYMRQLYRIFGDWELVLAAYNTGPGNVKRAIRRSGNKTSFWEIYNNLHKQTRGYVPQYTGMVYMMHHANDHDIVGENFEQPIAWDTVHVNTYLNIEKFAEFSLIPYETIQKLNPHILKNELPAWTRGFALRIPTDLKPYVDENRQMIMDSASKLPVVAMPLVAAAAANDTTDADDIQTNTTTVAKTVVDDDIEDVVLNKKPKKTHYKVRRGETLYSIADKFNVDVYDLRIWNKIKKKQSSIRAGQQLVIYKEQVVSRSEVYAKATKKEKKSKYSKGKYHTVQVGDTLWEISKRYGGLSIDKIKKINHIKGNSLRTGQRIKIS